MNNEEFTKIEYPRPPDGTVTLNETIQRQSIEAHWRELAEHNIQENYELHRENARLQGQINLDQCLYDIEQSAIKADRDELLRLRKENEELKRQQPPEIDPKLSNPTHINVDGLAPCLHPYGELLNNRFAIIWEAITSLRRRIDGQQTELDQYEKESNKWKDKWIRHLEEK